MGQQQRRDEREPSPLPSIVKIMKDSQTLLCSILLNFGLVVAMVMLSSGSSQLQHAATATRVMPRVQSMRGYLRPSTRFHSTRVLAEDAAAAPKPAAKPAATEDRPPASTPPESWPKTPPLPLSLLPSPLLVPKRRLLRLGLSLSLHRRALLVDPSSRLTGLTPTGTTTSGK